MCWDTVEEIAGEAAVVHSTTRRRPAGRHVRRRSFPTAHVALGVRGRRRRHSSATRSARRAVGSRAARATRRRDPRRGHNPDGIRWLRHRLPAAATSSAPRSSRTRTSTRCSRLAWGRALRGDPSSNARALDALRSRRSARRHFDVVEAVADPARAVRRAHALGEPVLVTGSLYLLAELEAAARPMRRRSACANASPLSPSRSVLASIVGIAFAAGYILGKLVL